MTRRLFAAFIMAAFLLGVSSLAYCADKIAYVDLSRIFDEYQQTKEFDAALTKKQEAYEKERSEKLEKIQEAQGKLALLKESEKEKLQEQIENDKNALLEFDRQKQTDLRRERDEKIREILMSIEKAVREFAEKQKYTLILNNKVLIYGSPDMEVTEDIIKILNDQYSGGK